MPATVVIIGQAAGDPHIDTVAARLRSMDANVMIFDFEDPTNTIGLSVTGMSGEGYFRIGERRIDFTSVNSVWMRAKARSFAEALGMSKDANEAFVRMEWLELLRSLAGYLPTARWLNPIESNHRGQSKPWQLLLASSLGMTIPSTRITNDPSDVRQLIEQHGDVIYKPLRAALLPPNKIIFTTRITTADVDQNGEGIKLAPGIFQECIPKNHELRVTIVEDAIFCVKLASQDVEECRLDWRRNALSIKSELVELDSVCRKQLLEFHRQSGLVYAAYDLIVRDDGTHVFLECNPGGQWMWMEEELGLPISTAIAEALLVKKGPQLTTRA